ncbi:MAG: methylated-DNA--[protein]-cysteine S-methyltransferase [Actinomycetales bacterium]
MTSLVWTVVESPIDDLLLTTSDGFLRGIWFSPCAERPGPSLSDVADRLGAFRDDDDPVLRETAAQLEAYFDGERHAFDLPLGPVGTPFQEQVWAALSTIPYGETWSYGELAGAIGKSPSASRAVGLANGRNPIPVVIPCHRVIGADGTLTGFGGGLPRKRYLLDLEQPALFGVNL